LKNLHRGDAVEIKHQRHAELGEGPYENNRSASKNARHDKGEGDAAEFAKSRATEVDGGFFHGGIDIGQGRDDVQIEDRVKMQGIEQNDAP